MAFTQEQLVEAEQRLLENVTRVREGDTWVEYGSPDALRRAITYAKRSMNTKPKTQRIQLGSGY